MPDSSVPTRSCPQFIHEYQSGRGTGSKASLSAHALPLRYPVSIRVEVTGCEVLLAAEALPEAALQNIAKLIENEMHAGSMFLDDGAELQSLSNWLDKLIAHASANPMTNATAQVVTNHFRSMLAGWREAARRADGWAMHYEKGSVLKDMPAGRLLAAHFGTRRQRFDELIAKVVRLLSLQQSASSGVSLRIPN